MFDRAALRASMQELDVIYANLAGDMARQARAIIDAMDETGVRRLIFISSMGIESEVPGEKYRSILATRQRRSRRRISTIRSCGQAGSHTIPQGPTALRTRASRSKVTTYRSIACRN